MEEISGSFFKGLKDTDSLSYKKKEITPVIKDVASFFKKNKLVIYGGTAMNLYLTDKFYDKYDIPDYDGFHYDAKKLSIDLMNILKDKNYEYLMIKHAIHDGTYKLSWSFKDVADITHMNKDEYDRILKTSKKIEGLYVCDINLLKSNAYIELGMPKSSMFRWGKVFSRLNKLEKEYPIKSKKKIDSLFNTKDDELSDVIKNIKLLCLLNQLPFVGLEAIKYYCGIRTNEYNTNFPILEILSDNVYDTVKLIVKLLGQYENVEYEIKETKSQIVPDRTDFIVYLNREKINLLRIHNVNTRCVSVKTHKDVVYGSIFFLMYISYYELFNGNDHYKVIISNLIGKIKKDSFSIQCYGTNKSISVIKKSRMRNKMPEILAES